jgi:phosphoglycolate phosphatase-like HAD superfamily hydrolase
MAHDRGVILDVDGTLIDSNDAHARAWAEAGERLGYGGITYDAVRPLIGMGGDRILPRLAGVEADSPEGRELSDARAEIFRRRHLPGIQAFPRVRELLERLRDDGFDRVVASSASEEDLGTLLDVAGVRDLVRAATSSGDADESKPAPDIVEGAVSRANVDREALLMIGDTPYDVEAARRARVPIVAVRSGGWEADELDGAAAVYDDVADILEHYEAVFLDAGPFGAG